MLRNLVVAALALSVWFDAGAAVAKDSLGFVKGHAWGWVGSRGDYASPAATESMKKLAETGADTVCITFAANLSTHDRPSFTWGDDSRQMVIDDEVRHAIDLARENGLRVILKPVVNCSDGVWRAWIRFHRPVTAAEREAGIRGVDDPWGETTQFREGQTVDEEAWAEWWSCFGAFLEHYAAIGAEKQVDAFCLGCEMNSTESFEGEWRGVIDRVRRQYKGPLTYNVNHGRESDVPFWDEVDFLSISAYYPTPPPDGETTDEAAKATTPKSQIVASLRNVRDGLRAIHEVHQKPILFIEAGLTSVRGASRYPWAHPDANMDSPADQTEQANYYEAMFETFWEEPWFMGFAWWDWPARLEPIDRAGDNRGFCVYGKEAEAIVKRWYARQPKARAH